MISHSNTECHRPDGQSSQTAKQPVFVLEDTDHYNVSHEVDQLWHSLSSGSDSEDLCPLSTADVEGVLGHHDYNYKSDPQEYFTPVDSVQDLLDPDASRDISGGAVDSQSPVPVTTSTPSPQASPATDQQHSLPSATTYPGHYGFQVGFEQPVKDTKSANWTYSPALNKLYVRMATACPVKFMTATPPPCGSVIRAMPVYVKPEHVKEIVTRCPNHASTSEFNDNHPAPSHLLRCEHALARYHEDPDTRRQSVIIPHQAPQAGNQWLTNLYQFMCFSSCVGGLNRRPLRVIFTLEHQGQVLGRQSAEVRICACPGRDRRVDEKTGPQAGHKRKATAPGASQPGGLMDKRRKVGDMEVFTLSVTGRDNYEALKRMRDALELMALIPAEQTQMVLNQYHQQYTI